MKKQKETEIDVGSVTLGICNMTVVPTLIEVVSPPLSRSKNKECFTWHNLKLSICQETDTAGKTEVTINSITSDELKRLATLLNILAGKIK